LPLVLKYEGGYVNDPADAGGETYRGIARRYHPEWTGWKVIDAERRLGKIIDEHLVDLVSRFYREQFWDRFQGDKIPDQALADELLDQAVHLGVHRAIEHLQVALNAANDQGRRWADMLEDGVLGPSTLAAVLKARERGLGPILVKMLNCQQGAYYLARMKGRQVNEKYLGWFQRV